MTSAALLALLREAQASIITWAPVDHPDFHGLVDRLDAAIADHEAEPERKCEGCAKLRAEIKQMEKDHREDMRDTAVQVRHAERYPDEPPGTY